MIVAAATDCFPDLSFSDVVDRLVDLEYTAVEVSIHEDGPQLTINDVVTDLQGSIDRCQDTARLNVVAYSLGLDITASDALDKFTACCKLAKATKVVTLVVPSSELGTPFNEEVESLRRMTVVATEHGARVAVRSQIGRLTEDPDTVQVMCDHVEGLGLCLDPSHYICGPYKNRGFSHLLKYVYHVQLRDSKKDQLNVQIGQGEVDYGKLIHQLQNVHYDRALTTHLVPIDGVDYMSEMRKMRLLLESLLL